MKRDLVSRALGAARAGAATNTGVMARVELEQRVAEDRRSSLTTKVEALACLGCVPHLMTEKAINKMKNNIIN